MQGNIAGQGTKKPQIDIPLQLIDLDSENPRLDEEYRGGTQFDILKILH